MATGLVINVSTGEQTPVTISDTDIIATRQSYLELSWDGSTNTLSAQLKTPVLTDGQRDNLAQAETWLLQVGDVDIEITTDTNGSWSDTIVFDDTDAYTATAIKPDNANEVTIQDGV